MLIMKTEKHPVAMQICIAQDFSLSTFEFMHYFLEKLIILIMKTEKHPVGMQICIAINYNLKISRNCDITSSFLL
jgi:hypothetical protein